MAFSELLFTNLGPLIYNLIFLSLWILWIQYHGEEENGRIRSIFRSYIMNEKLYFLITGLIIIIILYLLFSYANTHTDVDDAITSGVEAFLAGHNPYQEDVVIHHLPSGITYGRYHYFPPDLLTYSGFYIISGGIFAFLGTYWFVPLHLLMLIPGYWFLTRIVDWPHHKLIPFYILLVTPFLFTNSMLMWFFFIIGYYYYEIRNNQDLGMIFYVFAASVKYLVGFIIVFYFFQSIQTIVREKNRIQLRSFIIKEMRPYLIGGLALAVISLPFNLIDVIVSVFLYQGDLAARGEVAQLVGPLLIEILKILRLESLYILSVIFIIILSLFLLRSHTTYEKIIHISFMSMFILPFYGTELFITLPFYWWFKEGLRSYSKE
ncbi:hypothetical protein CEE45_04265 [Candidatus Heimdallarchaeota archaeon B3_Heim]|nr:MAG: hypothetical protein CEE45_04265 [Candidatus Heimdallarchaeota archaeon B3_Heim]